MKSMRILRFAILASVIVISLSATASEISPAGQQLSKVLDSMHVEQLWLAGRQVDWRTGEPNGKVYTNASSHTHCSAFAAAAAEKLGIYLLHPPEHSAVLLANAQQTWLCSSGTNEGWQPVKSPLQAQQLANEGQLVIVTCKNPDEKRPGHIAIVRPSTKSNASIMVEGPEIIQAGANNYTSTTTKEGFKNHPGAFENHELLYFVHGVPLSKFARQEATERKPEGHEILQSSTSAISPGK
jgi:hypothetical protein